MLTLLILKTGTSYPNNVALTRADIRGLYNPLLESEYIPGGTPWEFEGIEYGSPIGPFGDSAVLPLVEIVLLL